MNKNSLFSKVLSVFFCTVKFIIVCSQEPYQPSKIIPPSPTAASLGVYGDFQVGYYNGTPEINIPLFEIKTANHDVPVRMQYNATGVRVAENAGWVGLGWSLSAGGVITRTVRGGDDFGNNGYYSAEPLPVFSGGLPGDEDKPYYDRIQNNQIDAEPDIFSYNFLNNSGRFVLGKRADGAKVFIDQRNNFKVEYIEYTQKWIVTTPDGYQYLFGTQERQTDYYYSSEYIEVPDNAPLSSFRYEPKPDAITAWYLDEIIAPSSETVSFTYETKSNSLSLISKSQSEFNLIEEWSSGCAIPDSYQGTYKSFNASRQVIQEVGLKQIVFSQGTIDFITTDRDDMEYINANKPQKLAEILINNVQGQLQKKYSFAYEYFNNNDIFNKRLKLKSITEGGAQGSSKPPYEFTYFYPNSLPSKYTKAIDHWGFYNGFDNTSLLPAVLVSPTTLSTSPPHFFDGANRRPANQVETIKPGVLSSVTFPTGGSTSFNYELNEYGNPTGDDAFDLTLVGESVLARPGDEFSHSTKSFDLLTETNVTFAYNYTKADENANSINGVQVVYGYVYKQGVALSILSFTNWDATASDPTAVSSEPGPEYKNLVLQPGHYTITMVYIQGYVTDANVTWYDKIPVTQRKGGGLRIESITNFSNGKKVAVKKYSYVDNGQTTGILISPPKYDFIIDAAFPHTAGCVNAVTYVGRMSSSVYSPSLNSNGITVGYSKVTESLGDNGEGGRTEYYFHNNEMAIPGQFFLPFMPWYMDPKAGRLSLAVVYDAAGNVLKKTEYTYDTKLSLDIKGIKTFRLPIAEPPATINPALNYLIGVYPNPSNWVVLSSVAETIRSNAQQLTTVTGYSYDNPQHLQITRKTVTRSDGKMLVTKYKYPGDYTTAGTSSFVAQMRLKNIIDQPIEEQNLLQTGTAQKLVGGRFTEYQLVNGAYKPSLLHRLETSEPLNDLTASDISATNAITKHPKYQAYLYFDKYNSLGGLEAYHKANDVSYVYIWGYKNTFPVAEVVGVDYTTANSVVNQSVLNDPQSTAAQISTELNNLRTGLTNRGALVTTYTYSPLIGMTSQTDTNGKTVYYEYDAFGRLKLVRDQDSNILKKYDYKYAGR